MLYFCNVCERVHLSRESAKSCAESCIQKLEGYIFLCDDGAKEGYKCPICDEFHVNWLHAYDCMFSCYIVAYDKEPFEEISIEMEGFSLCFTCIHCDDNKKSFHPCPQRVFVDEIRTSCPYFEADVRTFGTAVAEEFRLHNLSLTMAEQGTTQGITQGGA